jgi:hypothetical protein
MCFQTFKPNFGNIKLNKGFFQLIGTMQLFHNLSLETSEKNIKMEDISSEKCCRRANNSDGNGDNEERWRKAEITCKKI